MVEAVQFIQKGDAFSVLNRLWIARNKTAHPKEERVVQ